MSDRKMAGIWLNVLLYLFAAHSFIAGILLITLSGKALSYLGFEVTNRFFTTQSGVFHIVMAVCYLMAALSSGRSNLMLNFIIIAKSTAAVFLYIYYFFVDPIILVLLFGIGDMLMAVVICWLSRLRKQTKYNHVQ